MKKIVIAHKKGGVGKTTIAQCLCAYMQNNNMSFCAFDLDSQRQLKEFNDKREKPFTLFEINTRDDLPLAYEQSKLKEFCVFDMGGYDSSLSRSILQNADVIVIPLSKSANDYDGLSKFMDIINASSNAKALVVLNRIHHSDRKTHSDLKEALQGSRYKVLDSVIPASAFFESQLDTGITPLDKNILSSLGGKIEKFCIEVIKETK